MRIAFSGAVSTGKTTTAHALHNALKACGRELPIIDTGSRRLIDLMRFRSSGHMSPAQYTIFQLVYLGVKLANESQLEDYITDRSFVDVYAYWQLEGDHRATTVLDTEVRTICYSEARKYSHIFFFRMADLPFHDDGYRKKDPSYHKAYEDRLLALYSELGIAVTHVPRGSVDQRVSFILEEIRN